MNTAFFKNRYDASHLAGVGKVLSGDITLFGGVTEAMKNDVIVAMLLRQYGQRFYTLLDGMGDLEQFGFKFFLAGRDFRAHVTVQVSGGGHDAQSELATIDVCSPGHTLTFDRLVLDPGGNIVLMNEGVPLWLSSWRGIASQMMSEHGGAPKPLPILHSTVARIMGPANPSPQAAARVVAFVERSNEELQSSPLQFIPEGTFVGTTYGLLTLETGSR